MDTKKSKCTEVARAHTHTMFAKKLPFPIPVDPYSRIQSINITRPSFHWPLRIIPSIPRDQLSQPGFPPQPLSKALIRHLKPVINSYRFPLFGFRRSCIERERGRKEIDELPAEGRGEKVANDKHLGGENSLQGEVGYGDKRGERGPIWWAKRRIVSAN